jgi:hypothetical protein
MDCASFLWVLFGDILGHGGTHVDDEYIGRHCAIPNQFSAFRDCRSRGCRIWLPVCIGSLIPLYI